MDWTHTIGQFQGQGSIFWVAALSIAGGATLLLASGVVLAKRGLVNGRLRYKKTSGKIEIADKPTLEAPNLVQITDTGYTAHALALNPNGLSQSPGKKDNLRELHNRLKQAANALEDMHLILKNDAQINEISGLKAPRRGVEYVFKTGLG